jgi:tRNA(Ile)-lysidine synthase
MRGARPERGIELAVEREGALRRGERVLVACSGGPDSAALAGVVHALAPALQLDVRLAHVNHAVRASAGQDECVAAAIAAGLGLPFDAARVAVAASGEASLREARYAALLELARRRECTAVATAHHAEDQSETVLLALFRGAGPEGVGGMRFRRRLSGGVDLVRPLLRVPARELRNYCHRRGLPYVVDPSNADLGLRRNAVRAALEALRPAFPGLDEAVARAAGLVAGEREGTPRAALRRRVRERLAGEDELRDVDFTHVEAAVRALERGGSGTFHMKAGIRLEILRGVIAGISRE